MSKYIVQVQEVWIRSFETEALDSEEAKCLIEEGEGEEVDNIKYDYTLEKEYWTVNPLQ